MSRNRVLTEEMVFMRTKCNRMDLIRNLNLWGNDLCQIAPLTQMPNLEVLSLSVNRIDSLHHIRSCSKLTELYLRKNNVSDLGEVRHLRGLRQLKVLWLSDNPCATLPHYRQYVLHLLPGLTKLDAEDVTDEERRQAARMDVDQLETCVEPEYSMSEPQRRSSAPEMQEDMQRDRQPERRMSRSMTAGGYQDNQYPDQADFHVQPGGPQYHGHLERASTSGMGYDDHTPELTPRSDARGAEPRHAMSMPSSAMPGYGHVEPGANLRRSGGHPETLRDSYEINPHQPRSAWAADESPETPARARHGSTGGESGGESGGGLRDSGGSLQRSRYNGGGDRGGMSQDDPYMYRGDQDTAVQAEPGDAGGGSAARADNILCAVLALIKELDQQGLELVRRAIEQRQIEL